jgi:hypothetical protein
MARAASDVLAEHGFSGDRLLKLARRIALDELRRRGGFLDEERMEDLVGFLVLHACRAALRYDPERRQARYGSGGADPFASYVADVMALRVTDWYRSKAEGNGDRRHGSDGRIVLVADIAREPGDAFERELAARRAESGEDVADAERELGERHRLSEQARQGLHFYALDVAEGRRPRGGGSGLARAQARLELRTALAVSACSSEPARADMR